MPLGAARRERQTTVQSIQSLNGALLVYAENGSVLWGIQIQTDYGGGFLFKVRIVGCHITLQSMRLQLRLLPDTPDQVLADLHDRRHLTQRPMGGTIGWRLPRPFQHLGPHLRGQLLRWLTGMDRRQAQNAFLFIALLPSRDGRWWSPELFLNISIADTLIEQKNDPHALRHTCRQIPAAQAS